MLLTWSYKWMNCKRLQNVHETEYIYHFYTTYSNWSIVSNEASQKRNYPFQPTLILHHDYKMCMKLNETLFQMKHLRKGSTHSILLLIPHHELQNTKLCMKLTIFTNCIPNEALFQMNVPEKKPPIPPYSKI